MSETNLWATFWIGLFCICGGTVYALYQANDNSNKTAVELQNNCVTNGGSVVVGRMGDQQCIRFAK